MKDNQDTEALGVVFWVMTVHTAANPSQTFRVKCQLLSRTEVLCIYGNVTEHSGVSSTEVGFNL